MTKRHTTRHLLTLTLAILSASVTGTLRGSAQGHPGAFSHSLEVYSLFDNREYDSSPYESGYTVAGIWVTPKLTWDWQDTHSLHLGVSAFKQYGTTKTLDKVSLVAYYQLQKERWKLTAGIFDKKQAYKNTTDRFVTDKIYLLNPLISGLLVSYDAGQDRYANIWVDWTHQKAVGVRERFHAGITTSYALGSFFTTSTWSMLHVAAEERPEVASGVIEDLQAEILAGYRWQPTERMKLSLAVGGYGSFERDRVAQQSYKSAGLLAELLVQYRSIGIEGYTYYGSGHQKLRKQYGELLYQENPFLQSRSYTQAVGFWQIYDREGVNLRLDLALHLIPEGLFSHQALTLNIRL